MAKSREQALWDDSALINAFNDAIFKYKKMHNIESNINLQDEENDCNKEQKLSAHNDDSSDAGRNAETSDMMTIAPDVVNGMEESSKALPQELNPEVSEKLEVSPNAPYIQPGESQNLGEKLEASPNAPYIQPEDSQNLGDYEHLMKRYYEIEDQRQKVLQHLNQFGNWNNGYSSVPDTSQEHQIALGEAYPNIGCSFCPYGCQSWVAPCSSLPCCCLDGGGSAGQPCKATPPAARDKESVSHGDNDFVNTAMFAAERALSSIKEQSSASLTGIDGEKEKNGESIAGDAVKNTSSQTDLTVVLNAWYSAGFYTGKYLAEQASSAKDKHG